MAIAFIRGALDWLAKLGLTVRDDAPKTIDLANREWGPPAAGLALSIREIPKEDPAQLPAISAVLRNVSSARAHLDIPAWLVFYRIDVTGPYGQRASQTPFGTELLKPERHPRGVSMDLDPGQAIETEIPIGSIFNMRSPGDYNVKVSAPLPANGVLQSNEIVARV